MAAGELEQSEVEVGAYLVADSESFELVEPGEGSLDDPACFARRAKARSTGKWSQACELTAACLGGRGRPKCRLKDTCKVPPAPA